MFDTPRRWSALVIGLVAAALLLIPAIGQAQSLARVRLSPPVVEDFPQVTFLVNVLDSQGRRVEPLNAADLQILEDGNSRPIDRLEETQVGSQQLYVINTNQGLGIRDSRGRTRFDFVRQALLAWWSGSNATAYGVDELSLIIGQTNLVERGESAATLAAALDAHQPDFSSTGSGLSTLLDSLRYLDPSPGQENRPSVVVYFTSLPREPEALTLTNLIDRARQLGTVIHPVLIDTPEAIESEAAEPLFRIAESTGGQVFTLDPTSPTLPELAELVASQRLQYRVMYTSGITQSGSHELQVNVETGAISAQSDPRSFEVQVQPPDVTFIQAPLSLTRESEDPSVGVQQLPPTEQSIEILITYADGNPRPLASSQLLANGDVVVHRTSPPFDSFTWDLTSVRESQTIELQAVVTDSLGLESRSVRHSVQVTVVPPPGGLAALGPALGSLLLVLGVLVAGALGAFALLSLNQRDDEAQSQEPVASTARPLQRAQLRPQPETGSAEALLIPFDENGQDHPPIPLTGADITLGSDASLAAHPFSDPSVSSLHARVIRQAGGNYLIRDQGSTAGTWVNYDEVPEEGRKLTHGDVIHLGRVQLRFRLSDPPEEADVRIEPLTGKDRRLSEQGGSS